LIIADIKPMMLIGIEEKTRNSDEVNGIGKIPTLIQTFYNDVLIGIPNREGNHILAVYTDYETDEYGLYTYFIGAKVKDLSFIPEGLVGRKIPSGRYAIIPSAKGKIHDIVIQAWQSIWQDNELKKIRAYSADFEFYDERFLDSYNAQIDIYIAVQ
jgi:predicted transcriptional regulator YdeE